MPSRTPPLDTLGARIAAARRDAGIAQRDLAEAVGLDPSALSRIESGQRTVTAGELSAVARHLGTPPAELLAPDGQPFGDVPTDDADVAAAVDRMRQIIDEFEMYEHAAD